MLLALSPPPSAFACLGFGQPAAPKLVGGDAGHIWLDVQDGRAVQHVDAAHVQVGALAAEQADDCKADGVWAARRAGGKNAVRPVVEGRVAGQFKALRAVECPEHEQVREALDIEQPSLKLRQNAQNAFRLMRNAEPLRNGRAVLIWANYLANGTKSEGLDRRGLHPLDVRAEAVRRASRSRLRRLAIHCIRK